jgi:hypothetical protein
MGSSLVTQLKCGTMFHTNYVFMMSKAMASWVGLLIITNTNCFKNLRNYYIWCHKILVTWAMWELTKLVPRATNQYHPWRRWWQDGLWALEVECCMGS